MTKSLRENPMAEILPLLRGDLQNLQIFFESGNKHVLKKDNTIISQGNTVDRIYFLTKGKLKVTLLTDSGDEKLFWYVYPYSIFGDVPFFLQNAL